MSAAPASSQGGLIDEKDLHFWTNKLNDVAARPAEVLKSKAPVEASSWHESFFGCFSPVDLCCITWCLPCITFGKTHHQLHKDGNLAGYSPLNTNCLLFCGSSCCGLWWIPTALQRADIREKYNLQGSCLMDIAAACCCHCCSLVQSAKEVDQRKGQQTGPTITGYENQSEMAYNAPQ